MTSNVSKISSNGGSISKANPTQFSAMSCKFQIKLYDPLQHLNILNVYRREANIDVEVSASGYIKELHEDYEELSDEEPNQDATDEPEDAIPHEKLVEDLQTTADEPEDTVIQEKLPTAVGIEVEVTEKVPIQEPLPLELEQEKSEHILELMPEPLEGDEEVAELSEMLTDWSGIKAKSRGAASVASMSTIHPDVIKQRVKKTITKRQNVQAVQRIRAKGEASAATRKKRENKDLIRSDGIWGWDN